MTQPKERAHEILTRLFLNALPVNPVEAEDLATDLIDALIEAVDDKQFSDKIIEELY
jgi:hypothetical protein